MMTVPQWLWEFVTRSRAIDQLENKGAQVEAIFDQACDDAVRTRSHWWSPSR